MQHPEWTVENSLTEPKFQTVEYINGSSVTQSVTHTDEEIREAMKELNINKPIEKFKRIEKLYADPPIQGQQIGLFSFTPARGAKPDEDGIYGMIKCRGVFPTQREANERAEYIFRNVDTYHKIFHCQVGRPFPVTFDETYFEEKEEIELKKKVSEEESAFLKMSREEEEAVMNGLKDRMKTIKEEMEHPKPPSDIQEYITLQVKRASLQAHIQSLQKAMSQYQESCDMLVEHLHDFDKKDTSLKEQYVKEYLTEAEKVGIEADPVFMGFLKNWN
jgi:hypothetical protein